MGQRAGVGDVVDRHEIEIRSSVPGGPEVVPADASEAVDPYLDRHRSRPPPARPSILSGAGRPAGFTAPWRRPVRPGPGPRRPPSPRLLRPRPP
jgi:hypothetical protein